MCQLQKSYLSNEGSVRIFALLKSRSEWNLKFIPKVDSIKWYAISFHLWVLLSYNCAIHEDWRFAILKFISIFLRSPSSKEFHRVSCLILAVKLFQMNAFSIFSISSVYSFQNEVFNGRYVILDRANVLKINGFPYSVIFLILYKFQTFCIFEMLFTTFFHL